MYIIVYCNLRWYISCAFIFPYIEFDAHMQISDAQRIWQRCLLSPASGSSALMLN